MCGCFATTRSASRMRRRSGRARFAGLPNPCEIGRYHSLIAQPDTLPAILEVTARTPEGEIMGVRHKDLVVEGVQFHLESVLTPDGPALMANFLKLTAGERRAERAAEGARVASV